MATSDDTNINEQPALQLSTLNNTPEQQQQQKQNEADESGGGDGGGGSNLDGANDGPKEPNQGDQMTPASENEEMGEEEEEVPDPVSNKSFI